MHLEEKCLRPAKPIFGFANQPITVKGQVTLPVTLGQGKNQITVFVDFIVSDQPSVYNAIIGCSLMKKTKMVSVVYCLVIKFPTPTRIEFVRANQSEARSCHLWPLNLVQKCVTTYVMEVDHPKDNDVAL